MRREIEERMASDLWSHRIASGVMRKRQRRQRIIYSASSLATAALVVFTVLFTLRDSTAPANHYSDFITLQVQGTHNASLQEDVIMTSAGSESSTGVLLSDKVDEVIEDTVLLR